VRRPTNLFVVAIITEREGGFYIQLHNRLARQQPDHHIPRRFESRAEAEAAGKILAGEANAIITELGAALAPPGGQSRS
jgi:hypothetical protein